MSAINIDHTGESLNEFLELTILMPCLDEAETIVSCIVKAKGFLARSGLCGEVLVADNGSTDESVVLARDAGARVIHVDARGYGEALRAGIAAAHGAWVVMGDADDSYDFGALDAFIDRLRSGSDFVIGNRFAGGILPGAMPPLHRYLGNPVLSAIGRLFFRSRVGDFHCGLRAFKRVEMLRLGLRSSGMEFASEMVVKATLAGLQITEVPTRLSPDGRSRPPHLRSWRDGWRHLRFLLLMSPRWLFLYPGLTLLAIGALSEALIVHGPITIDGVGFDIHTMLYSSAAIMVGLQVCLFGALVRAIGTQKGVLPVTRGVVRLRSLFTLERGIVLGLTIAAAGFGAAVWSVKIWISAGLSGLRPEEVMRIAIPSVTLLVAGAQIVFASFFLDFLNLS